MRCDEVTQALSTRDRAVGDASIRAHLDSCPACADFAEQAAHLDRLWAASTPVAPAPEAWLGAWSQIESRFADAAIPAPSTLAFSRRGWASPTRIVGAVASLAAAAALLAAFVGPGLLRGPSGPGLAQLPANPAPVHRSIEVEPGQVVLYSIDQGNVLHTETTPAGEFDDYMAFLGVAEMLPDLVAQVDHLPPTPSTRPLAQ